VFLAASQIALFWKICTRSLALPGSRSTQPQKKRTPSLFRFDQSPLSDVAKVPIYATCLNSFIILLGTRSPATVRTLTVTGKVVVDKKTRSYQCIARLGKGHKLGTDL
jgi:hypothetical protein